MTDDTDGTEGVDSTGPAEHLSTETIADLQEGLLEHEPAQRAQGHLLSCPVCAAEDRALKDVPRLLVAAGDAGPTPADVVDRVDAALAAEPSVRPAGAATVTALADHSSRPSGPRPPLGMRVLQAAAVLVVLLAGAALAVSAWSGGSDTNTNADSSAGATAQGAPEAASAYSVTASGRNWDEKSVTAAVPELVAGAFGSLAPSAAASGPDGGSAGGGSGGDDSDGDDSDGRARDLAAAPAARLADGPALAECVGRLNLGPVTPLAVDIARWKGSPAGVIVLPTPDDPATVDVFVVEPSCPDGTFLFFTRAPRP